MFCRVRSHDLSFFSHLAAHLKHPLNQSINHPTQQAMLEPLGDPYTRFLPPAQYDSLYGLATGSVAGVGVSLFIDPVRFVFCPRMLSSRG